ncbi:disintegrin and metalloproteinase domain-containing protein 10-like [Actinia tenebrosa]|uniref:ADAM10 endopeptidase n=1 Tax=Actinia tenebrosa TaxID=6105 RepID=A0A6P8J5X0_ACTTE|nr:disintegrin and metalloproteinase domain-containing protein 10-like [Actinia tenebrosa]
MFSLTLCVVLLWCCVLTTYGEDQRPLSEYIKYYETLSYSTSALSKQHDRHRRSLNPKSNPILLNFEAHGRKFKIRLRRHTSIFSDDFVAENAEFDPSKIVEGEVLGHKRSIVHGFISDGIFEGKIHAGNDEFHVEPSNKYFQGKQPFHSVIYKSEDVHYPYAHGSGCGMREQTKKWMEKVHASEIKDPRLQFHYSDNEPVFHRYRRAASQEIDSLKKSCKLFMQADHLFTENVGQGNKERALLKMTEHVQAINTIYPGIAFFGSTPDKIEFVIARMLVNDSNHENDPSNPFRQSNIGVEKLLELNSQQKRNERYCLGYIFTYRDFNDGVLGLAWVGSPEDAGGICEKERSYSDGKKILNTGVVTFINYGKAVPQRVSEITFAHEVGHNFGSPHDESGACTPGGSEGNYIMFARATEGSKPNNRKFSSCSIEKMAAVMRVKAVCKDHKCCFEKAGAAICGNAVVEKDEECDCGFKEDESCQKDKCCEGAQDTKGCKLVDGKKCSPSQGLCCNEKTCEPHPGNFSFLCQNETECRNVSYCNGVNASCPLAPAKPNLTPCMEGRKLCENGSCSASVCKAKGYLECQCSQEEKMCDLCCDISKDPTKPDCKPTSDIDGFEAMKQLPSAACDNFNGYCDVFLKCRKVDADGPLNRLRKKFLSKEAFLGYLAWIKKYWWAVVLMGVGLILLMAAFIKLCSVHTPSSNPNKKPARQLTLRRQQRLEEERNRRARQARGGPEGYPGPSYGNQPPPPYPGRDIEMRGHR